MQSVENQPLIAFLDTDGEDCSHRWHPSRKKQPALAFENEVQVGIFGSLLNDMVAFRVLFFHEMNFLLLQFFHTDPIFISKMWHETQKKVDFLNRDGKLILCDYIFVYICINLNNFRLRCFACGEIIPRHRSLTKSEISILVNVMRELVLYVINDCQVKLTSEQEVKVLRLISLLIEWLSYL